MDNKILETNSIYSNIKKQDFLGINLIKHIQDPKFKTIKH